MKYPQHSTQRKPESNSAKPVSPAAPRATMTATSGPLQRAEMMRLQRTIGNWATGQLVQAKLTLGPAGDKYEQEADRTARQVMRSLNAPNVQRNKGAGERQTQLTSLQRAETEDEELQAKPLSDGISAIQRAEMEDEEELQAKPLHGLEGGEVDPGVAATISSAKGGGAPLHDGVRASMERGFGANFSRVRVHTDSQADALNRSLNAKAFTSGRDLFFRRGEYNPGSSAGQELIAHELTHTVQQGAVGVQRSTDIIQRGIGDWFRKKFSKNNTQQNPRQSLSLDEVEKKDQRESRKSITLDELDEESTTDVTGGELLDGPNSEALRKFQILYTSATHALDLLKVNPDARIAEFGKMTAEVHVEDYSAQIFGNHKVQKLLKQIDTALSDTEAENDAPRVGRLVADMLLFASLIPSQTQHYKKGAFGNPKMTRLTANVLSPARLIQNLIQIAQQVAGGDSVTDAPSLRKIDFDDKDSVAQSMLKLSLSNMQETAREHLQGTPLFQKMLESPDILRVILASGGAIDQRFQNTCVAAAINQEVQANVSSIAGLLVVGRGVASHIENKLSDEDLEENLNKTHKRRGLKKTTIREHAANRVKQAREAFTSIETRAMKIMQKSPVDTQALQALTQEWSRVMQKLAAVVNLEEGTVGVPVLSKTRVREHWNVSAVAAFARGALFDRPGRRMEGLKEGPIREALGETLDVSTSTQAETGENLNTYLGKDKHERSAKLLAVWDKVFEAGGTELSIPGHALYMQAMIKNKQKMFIVGDPLINKHESFTIEEMEKYARNAKKKTLNIRPDVLEGVTPPAFLIGKDIPLYTNPMKLGQQDEKYTVLLTQDAKINEAKPDKRNNQDWINVTVKPVDKPEQRGWIDPKYVTLL